MDTSQLSVIAKITNTVLNNSERVVVIEEYFKTKLFDLCSKWFELKLPIVSIPIKSTVYKIVQKFKETGSVVNLKRNRKQTVY